MPLPAPFFLAAALVLSWIPQTSNTNASLRGLSVVSSRVVWASGTAGTFLRTTDAGIHWQAAQVAGAESLDFRDVQAFDQNTALLLASGTGQAARVYKTNDAGAHWILALQNPDPTGFFDAFAFWDRLHGILLGDPVAGRFTIFVTEDGGGTWVRATQPASLKDEGAFAASGTCLTVEGRSNAWFGTGGTNVARVFHTTDRGRTWNFANTPMALPVASGGIFSLVFTNAQHGFAAGGDYRKPTDSTRTLATTTDGGKTWSSASILGGYRSGILHVTKPSGLLIAVGSSGSDFSTDKGKTWQLFANGNFNAVAGVPSATWAVGPKGSLAKLSISTK